MLGQGHAGLRAMGGPLMGNVLAIDQMLAERRVWRPRTTMQPGPVAGEGTGHGALDALLPQGGWPRRALCELLVPDTGVGEVALLAPLVARMTRDARHVVLVAPPHVPYAPAWQALGVDLRWLVVVQAQGRQALWAFEQCLRSAACAVVVGWPGDADARALRRLQVAADTGECLGFAVRDRRHAVNPSPAPLRMEHAGGRWHVRKCRGAPVPAQAFAPVMAGH